jgi:hypothetical protein
MKLRINWSGLNAEQRKSIKGFYAEQLAEQKREGKRTLVLNQQSYLIDSNTGQFVPTKDF